MLDSCGASLFEATYDDVVRVTASDNTPFSKASNFTCSPKVLHVINGEHFSGAERVQQLLGHRLGEFGVQSEFACIKPGKFPELCGLAPTRITLAPMRGRVDMRVVKRLAAKVQSEGFNLLHAHTPRSALVTSFVSLRTGTPWCYHVHSPTSRDSNRGVINRINTWIERYAIRNCTRLLTVSESLYLEMLRQGVSGRKLKVVPNGVPAMEPIDADSRIERRSWRIGLIALMRPRKGVEVALDAFAKLKQRGAPIELELIGGFETEAYERQIRDKVERLDLQGMVTLSGFTQDISTAIHRLDALLLPSLFGEGMPMVVLEALAAAVPVVATQVEGVPEIVRESIEGFLAEPGSAESLVEKILLLTQNRTQWAEMSRAAANRHRRQFSDQKMAQLVAEVYCEVLERGAIE